MLNPVHLRVRLVDLVDRHDDRHFGRTGVIDRFEGLGHDAVVGRHHQDHDIGDLGAAGTHAGEGFVTGRVDEDDLIAVLLHVIRADVLRNAAGFPARHVRGPDRVEQRGLTVIDVAHDGDHGRTANQVFVDLGDLDILHRFLFVGHSGGGGAEFA